MYGPEHQFFKLNQARRTIRSSFLRKPVSEGDLKLILEAARWAPSGHNIQPWTFIVVDDEKVKAEIAESTMKVYEELLGDEAKLKKTFGSYREWFHQEHDKGYGLYTDKPTVYSKEPFTSSDLESIRRGGENYCKLIVEAPLLIVALIDTSKVPPNISGGRISMLSVGAALQNIRLACEALGLGCQDLARPIDPLNGKKRFNRILEVPEEYMAVSVMRIGYVDPKEEHPYKSHIRKPLAELIHHNRF